MPITWSDPSDARVTTYELYYSADAGRNWEEPRPIAVQGKMPDLWETAEGRLLLVVGCEGNAKGFEIYHKRERRTFNVLFIR